MKTKHTPGPWIVSEYYSDCLTVLDKDGFEIVEATGLAILQGYSEKLGIAHWADSQKASREIPDEERKANARLIAAAPELLESLEGLCGLAELRPGHLHDYKAAVASARAAIAKATGEA